MRRTALAAALAVTAALLVATGCALVRLDEARRLVKASEPFEARPDEARASLLVVGDSTAVGTGASTPGQSVVGGIARALPRLSIANLGEDGARFADVAEQLANAPARRYDAVLILAGGNDVIRFTTEAVLRETVARTLERAKQLAPLVIVMPAGNVGNAPFFFPPVTWLMSARARTMHAIVRDAAQREGIVYVDLYKPRSEDPFALQPKRMHAADGLHPSDDGYAQWRETLFAQSPLPEALAAAR